MKTFIGTKIVQAQFDRRGDKDGYAIVYPDGYKSWTPAATFEECYRPVSDAEAAMIQPAKARTRADENRDTADEARALLDREFPAEPDPVISGPGNGESDPPFEGKSLLREATAAPTGNGPVDGSYKPRGFA